MSADLVSTAGHGSGLPEVDVAELLAAWLVEHPEGLVGAVDGSGAPVGMPASVPLGPGHQVDSRSLLELVVPEDSPAVTDAFIAALRTGLGATKVHMASAPDEVNLLQYLDLRQQYGIVLRVVTPGEDTDKLQPRVLDVAQLQPARPRLGYMTKDELATITSIDEATSLMLGWSAEEIVGRRTLELIHPDDQVRAIDNWMSRFDNPTGHVGVLRMRYRCRDGSWLWVETSNEFHTRDDGSTVVVAQLIDISDEMNAVEALRRSESFLRRMSDTLPVGLFQIGTDGRVVFVNPVLAALLGDAEVVTQTDLARRLVPEHWSVLDQAIEAAISEGQDVDLDLALALDEHGGRPSCRITLRAVVDEDQTLGVLGCVVDVTELKAMADTDSLTGLANRRSILEILDATLGRYDGRVAVIFVDLDDFKPVNDRYGHQVGDQVLAALAQRLRSAVRPMDEVGRIGGDEFLVVCPGVSTPAAAMKVASRLEDAMRHPIDLDGLSLQLSASFGVACAGRGMTAGELVATADSAMYESKEGRTGSPVFLASAPEG